jgi:hypothetical protein
MIFEREPVTTVFMRMANAVRNILSQFEMQFSLQSRLAGFEFMDGRICPCFDSGTHEAA